MFNKPLIVCTESLDGILYNVFKSLVLYRSGVVVFTTRTQ